MTNPSVSTDPKWAAQQARLQVLEEAAQVAEAYASRYVVSSVNAIAAYRIASLIRSRKALINAPE